MKFVILIFCLVFIVANCLSCIVWGQFNLYEPFVGVDVGDFVERVIVRAGGVVGGVKVGKLVGGAVTALDDDGNAWGWCLFAVKDGMKESEMRAGSDDDAYHHNEKDLRIMFYFEANDGGQVRFDDIPEVVKGVNTHHEIVGNDGNGIFYSLLASDGSSGPNKVVGLSGLVMFPRLNRSTAKCWTANAINDKGWIAGSYSPDGSGGTVLPMLFIPQDVNNNGVPDIRDILWNEIVGGADLDVNGNWLLDWAENDPNSTSISNMRIGLQAPGLDNQLARDIQDVQIARFPMNYKQPDQSIAKSFPDNYGIYDVVGDDTNGGNCGICQTFTQNLESWIRRDPDMNGHSSGAEVENEVVITLRNRFNTGNPDDNVDEIPAEPERSQDMATLRLFAYRYADCVDYMQFGNESFQGAGEFYFAGDGVPKISNKVQQDLIDSLVLIQDWIGEQVDVARQASALAGRPLRFIAPGVPGGVVVAGYTGNPQSSEFCANCLTDGPDKAAYIINEMNTFDRGERMLFDLHLHYRTVPWALGDSSQIGVIAMVGDGGGSGWPGNGADGSVSLEWGPKAANTVKPGDPDGLNGWWVKDQNNGIPRANGLEFAKYVFENDDGNPNKVPFRNWELFVGSTDPADKGFEFAQYGPSGFQMFDILTELKARGYTAVCYGPVTQGANTANVFNVAALIATQVSTDVDPVNATPLDSYIQDDDRYSPLRALYENAASSFILGNTVFKPHALPCDSTKTCPGCP